MLLVLELLHACDEWDASYVSKVDTYLYRTLFRRTTGTGEFPPVRIPSLSILR